LASEIEIHKSVKSEFVVKYEKHFEDINNVYILLELCTNQTMNELIKRRKRISEIEARYYLRQIALAMRDFQEQLIIHRDLKLGNLLLTESLEIRISDFGLAAKLNHRGERRKTMCGTPNYIAPEILESKYKLTQIIQIADTPMKWMSGVWESSPMLALWAVRPSKPTMSRPLTPKSKCAITPSLTTSRSQPSPNISSPNCSKRIPNTD
jgi:serine/threonine protein kinase